MWKKYCDKRFLCYNRAISINFLSILFHFLHVWPSKRFNYYFCLDLNIFLGLLYFISYSDDLSDIYDPNKVI